MTQPPPFPGPGEAPEDVAPKPPKPEKLAERGIDFCREGKYEDGLEWLLIAVNAAGGKIESLPALAVAYLGFSMAKVKGEKSRGLKLCRGAIRREFYHPEAYILLAQLYLMHGEKKGAVRAIRKGLDIDPESTGLWRLHQKLGVRRPPVLPMLSRTNPLNRLLGNFRKPPPQPKGEVKGDAKGGAAGPKRAR